jgi:hypothetical protein
MPTKLTLTIEKETIKSAKDYAKEKGQSLSELVENYFKLITTKDRALSPAELSPRIKRLRGIIKIEEGKDYQEILKEELMRKYGK